jgi:hypothetical protein
LNHWKSNGLCGSRFQEPRSAPAFLANTRLPVMK